MKHIKDIEETLRELKIDINLFDEIILLSKEVEKIDFMDVEVPSIFIDDSFSERLSVAENLDIPVFDLDAVESLIDWKL